MGIFEIENLGLKGENFDTMTEANYYREVGMLLYNEIESELSELGKIAFTNAYYKTVLLKIAQNNESNFEFNNLITIYMNQLCVLIVKTENELALHLVDEDRVTLTNVFRKLLTSKVFGSEKKSVDLLNKILKNEFVHNMINTEEKTR